jgi:hypothetical protein
MLTAPLTRLAVVLSVLVIAATAWTAPMTWKIGGYVQARYTETFGEIDFPVSSATDNTPGTFLNTRPSVLIRATDSEHVFLQFFFSSRNGLDFEVQHAFAEYQTTPLNIRAGLSPIPFGYENPITSAALVTTERSQISNELIGPFALDRGVFAFYRSTGVFVVNPIPAEPGTFNAGIAAVNGEPFITGSDTNNTKNIIGRVGYFIPNGEIGVSLYNGKGTGVVPATMDRFGADLQWRSGPFTAIAEFIRGETGSVTSDGGYLTVGYRPIADGTPSRIMVYLRGDIADRNSDVAGDYFSRGTAGVSYYLNPTSKLQAEVENINDQLNPDLSGRMTLQYQIIF